MKPSLAVTCEQCGQHATLHPNFGLAPDAKLSVKGRLYAPQTCACGGKFSAPPGTYEQDKQTAQWKWTGPFQPE